MKTYKEKVESYFKDQIENHGLTDFKVCRMYQNVENIFEYPKIKPEDEEAFFAEFWRMINAKDLPDPEVLGRYSL